MNIFQKIWYWFFPKPVVIDRTKVIDRVLEQRVKTEVARQLPTRPRPRPPTPANPPRPQYDPYAAAARLREHERMMGRQREEERRRDDGIDIVDIAVGVAIGSLIADAFDSSSSSSSDSCSSSDSWSGGGGESGGGGSSGEW